MKLKELFTEMTARAGNLDALGKAFADHWKDIWFKDAVHIGDINVADASQEFFQVKKYHESYSIWKDSELVGCLRLIGSNIPIIEGVWINPNFEGQKIFSKLLWFLKVHEGNSKMLLGDIHSKKMQEVAAHGLSRFTKSWYKDGKTEPFNIDTVDNYYGSISTGWQLMLECEGDFSSWKSSRYKGSGDWIREAYDWQIE